VSYANHQGHGYFEMIVKQLDSTDHIMAGGGKERWAGAATI